MDVFLRRRQSGRKLLVWLWNKLTILAVRTVGRLTGAARDVAAHFAVTGWWNWPDQGNNLEAGHRVHEPDVASRGMLRSRCHLFLPQQTPLASSLAKTPVTGRFPVNAVRQEARKAPELVPDDSQYLLGQKQQQGRKFRYSNATRFASWYWYQALIPLQFIVASPLTRSIHRTT